jgi:hypothetical protein
MPISAFDRAVLVGTVALGLAFIASQTSAQPGIPQTPMPPDYALSVPPPLPPPPPQILLVQPPPLVPPLPPLFPPPFAPPLPPR